MYAYPTHGYRSQLDVLSTLVGRSRRKLHEAGDESGIDREMVFFSGLMIWSISGPFRSTDSRQRCEIGCHVLLPSATHVETYGTTITVPSGHYNSLSILETATDGSEAGQEFVLTNTDGTTWVVNLRAVLLEEFASNPPSGSKSAASHFSGWQEGGSSRPTC